MKTHGKVIKWNDERGFGFVLPANGEREIFAHISEFPKDGIRPRIGEIISFEVEKSLDHKLKVTRVVRPRGISPILANQRSRSRPHRPQQQPRNNSSRVLGIGFVALISFGAWLFFEFQDPAPNRFGTVQATVPTAVVPQTAIFNCDGRTLCSQMRSCAEATYFIQHCPNAQMDGNNDGEPCEQQWCN